MRSRKSIEGRLEDLEEGSGPLIDDFTDLVSGVLRAAHQVGDGI